MRKRFVEWFIRNFLKGYHLHHDPTRKVSAFVSPVPDFTVDGEKDKV